MAEAILFAGSSRNGTSSNQHISHAAEQHAEAILSALDLLQLLHDRGVLFLGPGADGIFVVIAKDGVKHEGQASPLS